MSEAGKTEIRMEELTEVEQLTVQLAESRVREAQANVALAQNVLGAAQAQRNATVAQVAHAAITRRQLAALAQAPAQAPVNGAAAEAASA